MFQSRGAVAVFRQAVAWRLLPMCFTALGPHSPCFKCRRFFLCGGSRWFRDPRVTNAREIPWTLRALVKKSPLAFETGGAHKTSVAREVPRLSPCTLRMRRAQVRAVVPSRSFVWLLTGSHQSSALPLLGPTPHVPNACVCYSAVVPAGFATLARPVRGKSRGLCALLLRNRCWLLKLGEGHSSRA